MKVNWIVIILSIMAGVAIAAHGAEWKVETSFTVGNANCTTPWGLATNKTSAGIGSFYVTCNEWEQVIEYTSSGTLVRNVDVDIDASSNEFTGIYINTTLTNQSQDTITFLLADSNTKKFVYVNDSFSHQSNSSISNCVSGFVGITSNATDQAVGDVWAVGSTSNRLCRYDSSLAEVNSFSLSGAGLVRPMGVTTNISNGTVNDFWITDTINDKIYHVDSTGTFLDSIALDTLGITEPRGIVTDAVNTGPTSFWIVDSSADKIFKITNVQATGAASDLVLNDTIVDLGEHLRINFSCNDDIGLSSAWLEINETGTSKNVSGKYGSPFTSFPSGAHSYFEINFTWENCYPNTGFSNKSLAIRTYCNNTNGQINSSSQTTVQFYPYMFNTTTDGLNVTSLRCFTPKNITLDVTGSGTDNIEAFVPARVVNATSVECSYDIPDANKVQQNNITRFKDQVNLSLCHLVITHGGLNSTINFSLAETAFLRTRPPANVPAAIAGGIVMFFVVIYNIVSNRRSGT